MGDYAENGDYALNGDYAGLSTANPIRVLGETTQVSEALVTLRDLVRIHGEGLNLSEQDLRFVVGENLVRLVSEGMSLSEADLHFLAEALIRVEGEITEQTESVLHVVEGVAGAVSFSGWGIPL